LYEFLINVVMASFNAYWMEGQWELFSPISAPEVPCNEKMLGKLELN
jgi:hypothetical protein